MPNAGHLKGPEWSKHYGGVKQRPHEETQNSVAFFWVLVGDGGVVVLCLETG